MYNFNVLETATPGTQIGHVYAYDRDLADNGKVQYFKQNDTISLSAPFDVNPTNGSIFVLPAFTRLAKKQSSYTMFIKAIDSALIHFERRHSVAVIQINVTDINNSVPEFIGTTPFEAYVGESLPEGNFVTQIFARDDDSITEQLEYSIVAGNDEKLFFMDSKSGKIYTSAVLDYERKQSYDLLVQVSDGVNTAVAPLMINIIDINDQQPQFTHQFYNFTVLEEAGANVTVGQMSALDRDSGKNALLTYSLVGEQANDAFVIDPQSGLLRSRRSLDCELEPLIDFVVVARDSGIPQLTGSANVRVRLDDLNDWAPRFEQARYEVEVQEELEAPVDIYQMRAHDKDREDNAIIKYLIIGGNEQNLFNINPDTGLISTAQRLNYETKREHRLQVAARNVKPFQGPNARTIVNPAVEILIRVSDINDEQVGFEKSQYHWKLSELTAKSTIIGRLNASNPARNIQEQDIIYWLGPVQILSGNLANAAAMMKRNTNESTLPPSPPNSRPVVNNGKLAIDEISGEIVLMEPLDRDPPHNEHQLRMMVYARDRKSINKVNASVPIIIDIIDANDNAPQFDESIYELGMPENLPAGTTIPTFFRVSDADSGLNGRIATYSLNGTREELDIFHINNVTGTITLKSPLDYERQSLHKFQLLAQDGGPGGSALIGSAQVVIQVQNINEFSPKFVKLPYEYELQENALPGTQVGQVKAIDQDGNKVVYSVSDGDTEFFAIEPATGRIYVNRPLIPRTQYSFIVRATDDGQPQNYSLGVQVTIRVRDTNDFAPTFSSTLYKGTVVEKQIKSGTGNLTLVQVEASDKDLQNNTLTYSIINGNEDSIFTIDKRTGEIRVAANQSSKIDYDKRKQYVLLVQARDSHLQSPLTGVTMVQLDVVDVNDHAPVFSKTAYVASLNENSAPGTCFFRVEADSRDTNDQISYSLSLSGSQPKAASGGPPSLQSLFEIHPKLGTICTKSSLDREQRAQYELTVAANDGRYETQVPLQVEILDENDNKPQFDSDQYQVTIPYDSPPGKNVINVHAHDPDSGSNGLVQYWIKNTHGLFQIDAKTGQVRLVTRLPAAPPGAKDNNATSGPSYELRVFAQDQGSSPLIGETTLMIRLTNIENHPPKFERFSYNVTVDENLANVQLIQLQAQDPDPGKAGKIVYRLLKIQSATSSSRSKNFKESSSGASHLSSMSSSSGSSALTGSNHLQADNQAVQLDYLRSAFKVDKSSGRVMLVEPLDYEETHSIELLIEARDEAQQTEATQALVQVQVNDLNDNKPEFLPVPRVLRVSSSTQPQNEVIYTLQALDADSSANGNNQIEYKLEKASRYFGVNPQTGQLVAIAQLPANLAETLTTSGAGGELSEAEKEAAASTGYSETLTVIAQDKSLLKPVNSDRISFQVDVYSDQADDGHPIFSSNQYFVQRDQPIDAGTIILNLKAQVPNGDPIVYNITGGRLEPEFGGLSPSGSSSSSASLARSLMKRFAIDTENGKISTTNRLEPAESRGKSVFNLIVRATNKLQPSMFSEAGVLIRLWDSSSRCPRFPFTEYYASVAENAHIDAMVVPNLVIDDVEKFAGQKLSYQITEDNSNDNFFIDVSSSSTLPNNSSTNANQRNPNKTPASQISVSLRVKKELDRESMPKFLAGIYTLTISASNSRCATQAKVKILVEDQNDNSPQFEKSDYQVELRENSPIGHVIAQLQATDADELDEHRLRYFIAESQPERDVFEMEPRSGAISVRKNIDRERASSYLLRIMAIDQANNTGWTALRVEVADENDWPPTFANETFHMNCTEGPASLGQRVRLPVYDFDEGPNRQMEVYIVEGNAGNEFRLDVDEGGPLLTVVQELDWEKFSQSSNSQPQSELLAVKRRELGAQFSQSTALHLIQIAAKDKGSPARIGRTNVLIYINDINDNAPKFTHESYYEFVEENAPVGSLVATVKATDLDSPQNTNLTYSFSNRMFTTAASNLAPLAGRSATPGPMPGGHAVAPPSGEQPVPTTEQSPLMMSSQMAPSSSASPITPSSSTSTTPGTLGSALASAKPAPVGLLAKPRHLKPGFQETAVGSFQSANSTTTMKRRFKRNALAAKPIQPQQQQRPFPFALNPITGAITIGRQLDTSEQQQYVLQIEASDGLWRTETQMRIVVNEVEDPQDLSARSSDATNRYRFSVMENQANALVGLVDLKPRKLRVNSQIKYSIVNIDMRQLFTINSEGQLFTLAGLDREQRAEYTFTVMLEERRHSSKLTVAEVIVEVLDENDQIPSFNQVYSGTIRENSPKGTPLFLASASGAGALRATDGDLGQNSLITYSLLGPGSDRFQITPNGQVLFSPKNESLVLDREVRSEYKLEVQASDSGNLSSRTSLTIRVEDENDNAPIFETGPLHVLIPETAKAGSKIVQVRARDRDEPGPNSEIHYKILSSTSRFEQPSMAHAAQLNEVIRIDQSTGELFVVGQLQPASSYNITIIASDGGGLSATSQVNVTVLDVNDHRPQFERASYNFVVLEGNYSRGALKLGQLRATDGDIGRNAQIEYLLITDPQYESSIPQPNPAAQLASILKQQQQSVPNHNQPSQSSNNNANNNTPASDFPISIDVQTGELFARGPIDREQRDTFMFRVMAIDLGEPALNSTCEVVVKVKDINDEPPRFYIDPYLALVPENLEPGHKVTQMAAFDPDSGDNGQVFYKLGEGHEGKFYIDGKDGTVWTLASLDYEQKNFYNITIIAYDRGTPSLHSSAKLWITVADMNDAVPNFSKAVYTIEVAESAKLGETIYVLNAGKGQFKYSWVGDNDQNGPDMGIASHQDHHLHHHHHSSLSHNHHASAPFNVDADGMDTFTIEPSSGHIKLAKSLDSVHRNHYRLMVRAQDESEPPKYDTAEINILVGTGQGVRLFSQRLYEVSVLENQLAPLVILDVNSTDEMIHQPVHYSIVGSDHRGLFKIEPDTGRISVTSSLDREKRDSYMIRVKAETGNLNVRQKRQVGPASGPQSSHINQRWSASTLSSTSTTQIPGQQILSSASGQLNKYHSSSSLLRSSNSYSSPTSTSSELISMQQQNNNNQLGLLRQGNSSMIHNTHNTFIQHSSNLINNVHLAYDETLIHIVVEDENDNAPVFSNKGKPIVAAIPLEASFGYEVARVSAKDPDLGLNAAIRYEIQAHNSEEAAASKFYIDPVTGVIRSMVNFALDSGRVYNFDVRATDREGQESGNAVLVSVFVNVLPETRMVLLVSDTEPIIMERRSADVVAHLSNVTGFDVKMAKLEPHIEGESPEPFSTDLFLYAVNPSLNNIVDTETLLNVFRQSSQTIMSHLHQFKIRRIQGVTVQEKISQTGTIEMAIIALSSVLSIGSIVALLFYLSCKSQRGVAKASSNSSQQSIWENHHHHHHQQATNNHHLQLTSHQQRALYGHKNHGLQLGSPKINNNNNQGDNASGSSSLASNSGQNIAAIHSNNNITTNTNKNTTSNNNNNSGQYLLSSGGADSAQTQIKTPNSTTCSTGDGGNSSEYVDSLISYKNRSSSSHNPNGGSNANQNNNSSQLIANLSTANSINNNNLVDNNNGVTRSSQAKRASKQREVSGNDQWGTIDSDLAAAIDEHHHLHHHHRLHHAHAHHHHQTNGSSFGHQMMRTSLTQTNGMVGQTNQLVESAMGGGGVPPVLLKGPRARLTTNATTPSSHSSSYDTDDPNVEIHSDNEIFGDEDQESNRDLDTGHHLHHHHLHHHHHH